MIVTCEALRARGLPVAGTPVVVQGYGNVGSNTARLLAAQGCRIVGLSDVRGGLYNPRGLDLAAVDAALRADGTLAGFAAADHVTNDELLTLPCSVLIPAALENQITALNAPLLRAQIVVEGANGPTTPEADRILHDRGIFLVPDILANAGGVTVSYFEWVQGLQSFPWSEATINAKLTEIMTRSFAEVHATAQERDLDMRTAAYILAVAKVVRALDERGIYP
jgi:glutamate dehydrogenase (NAD(P)+)